MSSSAVRVYSTQDAEWDGVVRRCIGDDPEPYFLAAYHRLHELHGDGVAEAAVVSRDDQLLFIPGLRVAIAADATHTDLQSCNGYAGPLATPNADPSFMSWAWQAWAEEERRRGGVAAFFRVHPLVDNRSWLPNESETRLDREVAYVDLRQGCAHAWQASSARHRNMVNAARNRGIHVEHTNAAEDWAEFAALYIAAMERLQAPVRLRYSDDYFRALARLPGTELILIRDAHGAIVSAAVFLSGARWCHYHLAARRADAPNYSGNAILQHAIDRAAERGAEGLLLGGGVTTAADDPLLKFKQGIGTNMLSFFVARVIADPETFSALTQARSRFGPTSWLLPYRQPVALEAS